jgi:simple sugar transport system ATP-binding protein
MTMAETALVRMTNIQKWFSGVHALKGVDFTVGRDEVIGLVGDNGAGKSTLIKILSGVYPPDEGQIYFEGEKINFKSPRDAIRTGIETIYQDTAVVPQMSIMRNIFMGREPTRFRIGPVGLLDTRKMADESMRALANVDLHLRSPATPVEELSGGEKQGVAIARAMYFKTRILILDEPTNNLSVKESERVLQFARGLKEQGVSSIFITHNLYHVHPVADRIVVMNRGEKIGDFEKEETSVQDLIELMMSS